MFSNPEFQTALHKLDRLLRKVRFPGPVDFSGLSTGDPVAFLPILSFSLTSFSPAVAELLMTSGLELSGKTDLRFTDTFYKVLRDVFHYKSVLNKHQFLQIGFSQRKISLTCDVINLVLLKHKQLHKASRKSQSGVYRENPSVLSSKSRSDWSQESTPWSDVPEDRISSLGEQKKGDEIQVSSQMRQCEEAESDEELEQLQTDEVEEMKCSSCVCPVSEMSELKIRLSAVEAQLQGLLSRLEDVRILEKRVEELEKRTQQKISAGGETISVKRGQWEDLLSRVFLLETKDALNNSQVKAVSPSSSSSHTLRAETSNSSHQEDQDQDHHPVQPLVEEKGEGGEKGEELRTRLENITNLLKNTSSLLKKTNSSSSLEQTE
ncbi:centrosomal protein of 44 kDa [Cynoglossus semilaevis]|uniref:Centrosomal protein of 44 kDa n=1 Tax=Cynoglossus semilaevis TaxID=244447 RepID=A0A3P8VRD6_CYNSE|nr:centrosomal protein of 44 kDa [Cynoglossus semilaevis]